MTAFLNPLLIDDAVRRALEEDLGRAGDITTLATIPAGATVSQSIVMAWYFPNRDFYGENIGQFYSTLWASSADVVGAHDAAQFRFQSSNTARNITRVFRPALRLPAALTATVQINR